MTFDRYLRRIAVCHTADRAAFVPWLVGGRVAGHVHRDHVPLLLVAPTPFVQRGEDLVLIGDDHAARSRAMGALVERLAASGHGRAPLGELYPVLADGEPEPLLDVDRAAAPWFGVRAQGVHLNGFVRTAAGLHLWLARRARGKRTFPGHLDNLVAGGQGVGMTALTTLRKEAHEEAGLPPELVAEAVPVGELRYVQQDGRLLKVDTLACFDLEVPASFTPRPLDGEVGSFMAWPVELVATSLRSDERWKPNCALVALHFLLRHRALAGELAPEQCAQLWRALHGQ
jgi:8-oxo-dGTP pyrophosphatase MutT (NUDIX family)